MAKIKTPVGSKSERARELFKAGKSVADVTREIGIGYAFAYGIAKRAGYAQTAANRRPTRTVVTDPATRVVTVQTDLGPVMVYPDGTVKKPTARKIKAAA